MLQRSDHADDDPDGRGEAPAARDPVEVLVEEFFERRRRGESSDVADFARRVPGREDEFRELVGLLGDLESAAGVPSHGGAPAARLGRFDLERMIGRGGMGAVYAARDRELGRTVALKILPGHATLDAREIERFRREAQAAARLSHPHIVPVFGVGEDDGTHWIAMQLVPGLSLDRVLQGDGAAAGVTRLSPAEAARHGLAIAQALACAHAEGVLHRDVKPSNLLLDASGTIWITDFGLAKSEGAATLTRSGEMVGTPRYMAPEAFLGWTDPRSDVWGVGVTLYEMLAGRPAFDGRDRARLMRQIADEEPPPLRRLDPLLPADLATIVHHCLVKEPAGRYATAQELADDLAAFLAGDPIRARAPSLLHRAARVARRHARATAAALVAAAAILALSIAWSVTLGGKNASLRRANEVAEGNLSIAEETIDRLLAEFSSRSLARLPELDPMRRAVLLDALGLQQRLLAMRQGDPRLRFEVAQAENRIGQISSALGRNDEARAHFGAAIAILRELHAASPADARHVQQLAFALTGRSLIERTAGDLAAEEAALEEARTALDTRRNDDVFDRDDGYFVVNVAQNLADCLARGRRTREAIELLRETLARANLVPDDPSARSADLRNCARACDCLGRLELQAGDPAAAAATLAKAGALEKRFAAGDDALVDDHEDAASIGVALADCLKVLGREEESRAQYRATVAELEPLAARWPTATGLRLYLAAAVAGLASAEARLDPNRDVDAQLLRARELGDACRAEWPDNVDVVAVVVSLRANRAKYLDDRGEPEAARDAAREAVAIAAPSLTARERWNARLVTASLTAHFNLGVLTNELGDPHQALPQYDRALELADWLAGGDGAIDDGPLQRARILLLRAAVRDALGRGDDALADWRAALASAARLDERLTAAPAANPATARAAAVVHARAANLVGNALLARQDVAGARGPLAEAVAAAERAAARWPDCFDAQLARAQAHADAGNAAWQAGEGAAARAALGAALAEIDALAALAPRHFHVRRSAAWIVDHLACALEDADGVEPLVAKGVELADRLADDGETQFATARLLARAAAMRHASPLEEVVGAGAHDPWVDAAFARLQQAAAGGIDVAKRARDDAALELLEPRDDYRRWLATLTAPNR